MVIISIGSHLAFYQIMTKNIDFGYTNTNYIPLDKRDSISLLLGAGFSVPMGYPTANTLADSLLHLDDENICFSPSGQLAIYLKQTRQNFIGEKSNYWQKVFTLCKRLIVAYKENLQTFDYEAFYDFLRDETSQIKYAKYNQGLADGNHDYRSLLVNIKPVFNQIVAYFIERRKYGCWIGKEPFTNYIEGYDGFLSCIKQWGKENIVNVHTLNHDTLFESFRNTEYLNDMVSDGFDEYGSDFYGLLKCGNKDFKVRLERYTARYNKSIRLYKLHGSLDYVPFHRNTNKPKPFNTYIKIPYGINSGDLLRSCGRKMKYELSPFELHADFLTGTTSKMLRYGEPFYKNLFKRFRYNLRNAEKLIIIGYGCHDKGINDMIFENFDKSKPAFVVSPNPTSSINDFAQRINATILGMGVESITTKIFDKKIK